MDYLGGLNVIMRVVKSGRGSQKRSQSQRRRCNEERTSEGCDVSTQSATAHFENGEKGHEPRNVGSH